MLPAVTWLVVADEPWRRAEKIAAIGVVASIAAAIAIYIGSRLAERRAAELVGAVSSHRDARVLEEEGRRGDLMAASQKNRLQFNLPMVAASFTGRDQELEELDKALAVADRAVITQAISGLGGVGKSQLAARYVQESADDYGS
jgi:hypothetical protein